MRLTPPVKAIFGLEIRSLVRDMRTLLMSVVLPVVLIPLLLVASAWMEDRRADREDARVHRVAVAGPDSAFAAALMAGITGEADGARFRWVESEDPLAALEDGRLDLFLEALPPGSWTEEDGIDLSALPPGHADARVLRIRYHSTRGGSRDGARLLQDHFVELREGRRDSILVAAGFPVAQEAVARVEAVSVAADEEVAGARLGRFLTMILMGLMLLGGSAVATDTLAGEKERGTLMTLLTSAASRQEIVTGKLLAIMAVALAIALVQVVNLWVFLGLGIVDPGWGIAATVSPGLAAGLLVLYLPVVALTAAVLLLTSAYARSYKEAQLYLMPVLIGMTLPTLAPLLPELSLQSAVLAVPIANVSLAARDLLVGQVHAPSLAAAWFVTAGAAAWVTARSVRALLDERLITGDTSREEFLGGPELFPRRVLRWFLVFWAVTVLVNINLTFEDLRVTTLVNVGAVFTLFPLLVIRHFRLDPREALALRMPRPGVWLGVVLGAPAALLVGASLFTLMDHVLPVPTELLEGFGQALLPETIPVWQLVLFISLVPGIAEELTFRGVLLHGLRRRFGPVALALVVGLIFGIFHFQVFRIPSTAFLGVVLTAVTLLSGSIFPAMLWHTLNNALAVYLGTREVDTATLPWGWVAAAVVLLAVAFWIIWRSRTPYPGVGPRGPRARPPERPPALGHNRDPTPAG